MKSVHYSILLTGLLFLSPCLNGASLVEEEVPSSDTVGMDARNSKVSAEPWRCPINVKLDLRRDELLECLKSAIEENAEKEVARLQEALEENDRQRADYARKSYLYE